MGKRMIDYGIMSSSTDSEPDDEQVIINDKPKASVVKKETEMVALDKQRRTSTALPTHEDYNDDY